MKEIAGLLLLIMNLFFGKGNDKINNAKKLRILKRTYRQMKRQMKKDGIDEEENTILQKISLKIVETLLNL